MLHSFQNKCIILFIYLELFFIHPSRVSEWKNFQWFFKSLLITAFPFHSIYFCSVKSRNYPFKGHKTCISFFLSCHYYRMFFSPIHPHKTYYILVLAFNRHHHRPSIFLTTDLTLNTKTSLSQSVMVFMVMLSPGK